MFSNVGEGVGLCTREGGEEESAEPVLFRSYLKPGSREEGFF